MYDAGHLCLLIFAQSTWKENYAKKLLEYISSNFLSQLKPRSEQEGAQISWNEVYEDPLFEPPPTFNCQICSFLSEIFNKKKRNNDGMILFSHNVLDVIGFKAFFTPLIKNAKIKKLLFLELSIFNEEEFLKHKTLISQQVHSYEIFELVDNDRFENGTLYEILNYK
ncbi:hypothetical protein LCGC14_1284800 [marine sediment metagenome]|uniref:Uncharacterized protein n=1 Tax=marine sediment metagenome TaxID=412755 RepID=A0A0F9KVV9_9ZZZZ